MAAQHHPEELTSSKAVEISLLMSRLRKVDPSRDIGLADLSPIRENIDHVTVDDIDIRSDCECRHHFSQVSRHPPVVAVELSYHICTGVSDGNIAGLLGSAVRCAQDAPEEASLGNETFGDRAGSICRTVVYYHEFEVPKFLRRKGGEGTGKERSAIEYRHADANDWLHTCRIVCGEGNFWRLCLNRPAVESVGRWKRMKVRCRMILHAEYYPQTNDRKFTATVARVSHASANQRGAPQGAEGRARDRAGVPKGPLPYRGFLHTLLLALLVPALIERELRFAIKHEHVSEPQICPEQRLYQTRTARAWHYREHLRNIVTRKQPNGVYQLVNCWCSDLRFRPVIRALPDS